MSLLITLYPSETTRTTITNVVNARSAVVTWALNDSVGFQFTPNQNNNQPMALGSPLTRAGSGYLVLGAGSGTGIAAAVIPFMGIQWGGTSTINGQDADDVALAFMTSGVNFSNKTTVALQ
jgi:hypothetical protein